MLEPIDIDPLKIERIFVASTGGQAACLPACLPGHHPHGEDRTRAQAELIAEGVEMQDQVAFMIPLGVLQAQGLKFTRAICL